jgi:hypothetical protein
MAGCVDYKEDLHIRADGAGWMKATMAINEALAQKDGQPIDPKEVQDKLAGKPGIRVETCETYKEAGKAIIETKVFFRNVAYLKALDEGNKGVVIGDIAFADKGSWYKFSRRIEQEGADGQAEAAPLVQSLFAGNTFEFTAQFPGKVIAANSRHIDGKRRTVTWKYTLGQMLSGPITMEAEIKKPFPMIVIVLGAGAAVLLVIAVLVLRRRPARR